MCHPGSGQLPKREMTGDAKGRKREGRGGGGPADPTGKIILVLILVSSLFFGLSTILIVPPWQSPDEPTHFEYEKVLALGDPPWSPRPRPGLQGEIIRSLDRYDYWRYVGVERPSPLPGVFRQVPFLSSAPGQIGKNPPLYYYLASRVLRFFPLRSLESELYRLRLLSLVFSLLTIVLVAGCAGEVFGRSSPLVPAATAVAAFLPQFLIIGTSVSPDPAINLVGAAAIYLILRSQKLGFAWWRILAVLSCLGLGILANYKGLIILAALPGVAVIHLFFHRRNLISPVRAVGWIGLTLGILVVGYVSLVWYYPGIARVFIVRLNILFSTIVSYLLGQTYIPPGYRAWFNHELFKSFWLKYGWLKFELPAAVYHALKMVTLLFLLGIGIWFARWVMAWGRPRTREREAVVTLLFLAAAVLGAFYLFWGLRGIYVVGQGRHLFLVMPSWAILFTLGWSSLLPARLEKLVGYGLTIGFFLFAAVSILFFILPTFS